MFSIGRTNGAKVVGKWVVDGKDLRYLASLCPGGV